MTPGSCWVSRPGTIAIRSGSFRSGNPRAWVPGGPRARSGPGVEGFGRRVQERPAVGRARIARETPRPPLSGPRGRSVTLGGAGPVERAAFAPHVAGVGEAAHCPDGRVG